jgi:hypothetical protein
MDGAYFGVDTFAGEGFFQGIEGMKVETGVGENWQN